MVVNRKFVCYFWFVSWEDISFGISINLKWPHIELHIPFGFVKIGWDEPDDPYDIANWDDVGWRIKGRH